MKDHKKSRKKVISLALILTLLLTVATPAISAAAPVYSDVPETHWAYRAIQDWSLSEKAILAGYGDGRFGPSDSIRALDLDAILNRILGRTRPQSEVASALTREQAAREIAVAFGLSPVSRPVNPFADDSEIAPSYKPYVYALKERGYMVGIGGNQFAPQKSFTRAEVVAIMRKALSAIIDADLSGAKSGEILLIRSPGVTLSQSGAKDIIVGHGVGDGDVTLDTVTVSRQLLLYGGGKNTVYIINSAIPKITIAKPLGEIRLIVDSASKVPAVAISEEVTGDVTVRIANAEITNNSKVARVLDENGNVLAAPGQTARTDSLGKATLISSGGGNSGGRDSGGDRSDEPAKPDDNPAPGPDNLADDIIDRGDIEELISEGKVEALYGDNGHISMIDGAFTEMIVNSPAEAAAVLNAAAPLFGPMFSAAPAEIGAQSIDEGLDTEENFYRYSPSVNGIPVLGSQAILVTDGDGAVRSLFTTYDDRINEINTSPSITADQAVSAAFSSFLAEESVTDFIYKVYKYAYDSPEIDDVAEEDVRDAFVSTLSVGDSLLIHAGDTDAAPVLVYAVTLRKEPDLGDGETVEPAENPALPLSPYVDCTYYIYANGNFSGDVYTVMSNIVGASETAKDLKDNDRTINVDGNRMIDTSRNISTHKTEYIWNGWLNGISFNPADWHEPKVGGVFEKGMLGWDKEAVSAHANIAQVYDYYKDVLGRNSFDDQDAQVRVVVDFPIGDVYISANGLPFATALWDGINTILLDKKVANVANGVDILGHEFTHGVIQHIIKDDESVGLYGNKQSWALGESFSDIMGMIIEGDGSRNQADSDWQVGEAVRDASLFRRFDTSQDYYAMCEVFDHAAYLMMTDSTPHDGADRTQGISDATWAKVFYRALYRLSTNARFIDARGAVISSAKSLGFANEQQQAIKDAFNAVGITEPDIIRIVLRWGATPRDLDSHLVGPGVNGGERFHIYFGQRDYYKDGQYESGSSSYAADLDYDDITSYGPEVTTIHELTPGDYYFYVHDFTNQDFSDSRAMANSGAWVEVLPFGSSDIPAAIFVVDPFSSGTYWNVFKLTIDANKRLDIIPINTYSSTATLE